MATELTVDETTLDVTVTVSNERGPAGPAGVVEAVEVGDITPVGANKLIGRHTGTEGAAEEISVDGGLEFHGSQIRRAALTGDVTASAGSNATTIAADAVTNTKLANMAEATIKGRASGAGTGDPQDLTAEQVQAIATTAASIDTALQSASAAQEDSIAQSLALRSSAAGIYDDFGDRTAYTDGATITHLSTTPRIGSAWRLNAPGTAPTVVHANGGLTPANGAGLFYIGTSARARNGEFYLAFELTPVATASPSGAADLALNVSFANTEMITSGGSIQPEGVVHINIDSTGIRNCDFYSGGGSTALPCRNATFDGIRYPWGPLGTSWASGRKQLITFEVRGDFLRVSCPGHGSLEFYHADLSTKISPAMNWWWEPAGSDAPGAQQYRRKVVLHRVTDSQERVQNEGWGGDALGAISSQGQANIPTRLRVVGDPSVAWKTGGTPTSTDNYYIATPERIGAGNGVWAFPWASPYSWYATPCYRNYITTEQSCPTGTDQTWSACNFDDRPLTDGQSYEIIMRGVTAANANTKRIKLRNFAFGDVGFGAGIMFDTGNFTDSGKAWKLVMRKRRITSHAHVFFFEWQIGSAAPVLFMATQTGSAGTSLPLTNLSTAGAAGDLKAYDLFYRMEPY